MAPRGTANPPPVVGARWNESRGQLPDEPTATGRVPVKSSLLGNVYLFPRKCKYSLRHLDVLFGLSLGCTFFWKIWRKVGYSIDQVLGECRGSSCFHFKPPSPVVGARWNESRGQLPDEPTAMGGVPTKSSQLGNVLLFPRKGTYSPPSLGCIFLGCHLDVLS